MATLQTKTIQPATGTNVDLGAAGDVVTLASDSIQTNLYKDSGGNTIFQSDGAGTLSNVNSALSPAGPKLILSQTASSSANISFTSDIDSTYDHYMFIFVNIQPASNSVKWEVQFNASGQTGYNESMTTVAWYVQHWEDGSATSGPELTSSGTRQGNGTSFQCMAEDVGNGSDESVSGEFHLFSPSNTTNIKQFSWLINDYDQGDRSQQRGGGGNINTTSAITEVQFKFNSGNINAGKVKMYGII